MLLRAPVSWLTISSRLHPHDYGVSGLTLGRRERSVFVQLRLESRAFEYATRTVRLPENAPVLVMQRTPFSPSSTSSLLRQDPDVGQHILHFAVRQTAAPGVHGAEDATMLDHP
jgi:hypothetical protein